MRNPPVLKNSPVRAQVTDCRLGVAQVSPGAFQWLGLQESAQLSYLVCCDHPTASHQCCILWLVLLHLWGHPRVVCMDP